MPVTNSANIDFATDSSSSSARDQARVVTKDEEAIMGFTPLEELSSDAIAPTTADRIPPAERSGKPIEITTPGNERQPTLTTEGSDETVTFGEVTVTNMSRTGEVEPITTDGILHMYDLENGMLLVGFAGDTLYQVNISNDTEFYIGTDRITPQTLRVNDIVEIIGTTYPDSIEVDATTVTVIGSFEYPRFITE